MTDAEVLPNLLKSTRRTVKVIWGEGAYDKRDCHRSISLKKATSRMPPPFDDAAFWEKVHQRNRNVGCQKLYGSNKKWKQKYGYHECPLYEAAT